MTLTRFKQALEYLGGAQDELDWMPPLSNSWFWGLVWTALCTLIYVFSGQNSKFIYIDF